MQITNAANYSMKNFIDLVTALMSNQKDMNATTKGEILFRLLEKYNIVGETNSTIILQKALQVFLGVLSEKHYWLFALGQKHNPSVGLLLFNQL